MKTMEQLLQDKNIQGMVAGMTHPDARCQDPIKSKFVPVQFAPTSDP